MMGKYFLLVIISFFMLSCQQESGLIEDLMVQSGKFDEILANAKKHRVQIIYTQIDRDSENNAKFKTHKFRVNPKEYFYPASSIKLPMAALALEKINDLGIEGLTAVSQMEIDSAFSGQTSVKEDTTAQSGKPSIAHYIKKLFLVSDNDAYNRLYEFLGQKEANDKMIQKGYKDIRFAHRLSIPLSVEENKCTNLIRFFNGDELVYRQEALCNESEIKSDQPIFLGSGYMKNGELIDQPMEFTYKNAIGLESLHNILLSIMFPQNFGLANKFNLTDHDYSFLYEFMSKYPKESDFPYYGSEYHDDYCKFLMFAGTNSDIDRNIRIYDKIGLAYGFLIDMAYIVDFDKKIEFVLGAVIYVNENEILNDGDYEYETVGFPFMRDLGQLFYNYELERPRAHAPDFNQYTWK